MTANACDVFESRIILQLKRFVAVYLMQRRIYTLVVLIRH